MKFPGEVRLLAAVLCLPVIVALRECGHAVLAGIESPRYRFPRILRFPGRGLDPFQLFPRTGDVLSGLGNALVLPFMRVNCILGRSACQTVPLRSVPSPGGRGLG